LQARRGSEARRLRRQRYVQRIGRSAIASYSSLSITLPIEFVLEAEVDHLLDRLARLSPDTLRALGADRLAAPPIQEVRR
jgi:hypothetical protein